MGYNLLKYMMIPFIALAQPSPITPLPLSQDRKGNVIAIKQLYTLAIGILKLGCLSLPLFALKPLLRTVQR